MDRRRFDALARALVAAGSRRGLLGIVTALPVAGGLAALLGEDEVAADGRRKRRKKRHKHGKGRHRGGRKHCKAKSKAKTCAGKCGQVKNNCKKTVDCGPCACDPRCPICQICDATRTCEADPEQQGKPCSQAGEICLDGVCVCGDVCESGCQFSSVQDAVDAAKPGDTITLCAGAFTLTEPITIGKDLTLIGAGQGDESGANSILDGNDATGVLRVSADTVALEALRITGGIVSGSGGGIDNKAAATLTLTACTVTGNRAASGGGGISNTGTLTLNGCTVSHNDGGGNTGGGIRNDGTLTLTDCIVSGNSANFGGGGISNQLFGELTLSGGTVSDNNSATDGGGIRNQGVLTLQAGATVRENHASDDGGGIYNDGEFGPGTSTCNGGSSVSENTAGAPPETSNCVAVSGGDCDAC